MTMNSLLADTLTRLRNAQLAKKDFTIVKSSKYIKNILAVLEKEGYISGFQEAEQSKGFNIIKVDLKYHGGEPVMSEIEMISKPGCRVYKPAAELPRAKGGLGVYIVSTSGGVMSDYEARTSKLGGELLCKVC